VTRLRTLVLVGLMAGLFALLGVTPANAAFSTRTTVTPMSIGTVTVQAPGAVKGTVACGGSTSTLNLSWTASSTPGVTGYVVRIVFSDGYAQTMPAQTATTWSGSVNKYYVTATTVHMTVTAETGYGWTRESLPSEELSC
jgi:hypothetical protein